MQLYEHMSIFAKITRAAAGLAAAVIAVSAVGFGSPSAAHAEPESSALPGAATTEVTLINSPSVYGELAVFNVTVTLSAPVLNPVVPGRIEVDGQAVGAAVLLLNVGAGKYSTLLPATTVLSAGTHSVVAFFDGTPGVGGGSPDALPSQSDPLEVTIAQRPTTTVITSAPSTFVGLAPIDVGASVRASSGALAAAPLSGNAVLLADGAPLIYEDLNALGDVWFEDVLVPWGTEALTVAYLGDTAGNFAVSTSAPAVVNMTPIPTESTLSISSFEIRADESLALTLRVEHGEASSSIDPSGGVEILVDGNSYYSEYPSENLGPTSDRAAQFEVQLSGLLPGQHEIVARFIPADGFDGSESVAAEVVVTAVGTVLTAGANQVSGTPARPAGVDVAAAAVVPEGGPTLSMPVSSGYPVDGYVQAFVGSRPIGDPVMLANGAGHVRFSGLAVGRHDVELRFTPTEAGLLPSSARVLVTITADASPNGSGGTGDSLSNTGGAGPMPYLAGALALALAGAGALLLVRRHRAS